MTWIMYGIPIPIERAEIVAVTGPKGMFRAAMIPNVQTTTMATGRVVMTPSIGLRDSNQKFATRSRSAAPSVSSNDDT